MANGDDDKQTSRRHPPSRRSTQGSSGDKSGHSAHHKSSLHATAHDGRHDAAGGYSEERDDDKYFIDDDEFPREPWSQPLSFDCISPSETLQDYQNRMAEVAVRFGNPYDLHKHLDALLEAFSSYHSEQDGVTWARSWHTTGRLQSENLSADLRRTDFHEVHSDGKVKRRSVTVSWIDSSHLSPTEGSTTVVKTKASEIKNGGHKDRSYTTKVIKWTAVPGQDEVTTIMKRKVGPTKSQD